MVESVTHTVYLILLIRTMSITCRTPVCVNLLSFNSHPSEYLKPPCLVQGAVKTAILRTGSSVAACPDKRLIDNTLSRL